MIFDDIVKGVLFFKPDTFRRTSNSFHLQLRSRLPVFLLTLQISRNGKSMSVLRT